MRLTASSRASSPTQCDNRKGGPRKIHRNYFGAVDDNTEGPEGTRKGKSQRKENQRRPLRQGGAIQSHSPPILLTKTAHSAQLADPRPRAARPPQVSHR